jgi:hypothetical protein
MGLQSNGRSVGSRSKWRSASNLRVSGLSTAPRAARAGTEYTGRDMKARSSGWLTAMAILAACGAPAARGAVAEPSEPSQATSAPAPQSVERVVTAAAVEPAVPAQPPAQAIPPACTEWNDALEVARLADPRLGEVSGLIASRAHPGVLYVHNDSGEPYARFFAITPEGTVLAEIAIDAAPSRDLEDIAYHDGWLYLADTGDNGARDGSMPVHEDISILRVREPELPAERGATIHVSAFERFAFRYEDAPHDCEALFIDPITSDVFFLSKENEGPVRVLVAHAPLSPDVTTTLEQVATMPGGTSLANSITAADISSDGGAILVRTYLRAFLYTRAGGETVAQALGRRPTELPVIREWQGEAIGFSVDGETIYAIPEGDEAPVHVLRSRCASEE